MYVLYVNLWGTTAKLPEPDVVRCQSWFHESIRRLETDFAIEAYPFIDFAYAFSDSLDKLVEFTARLFQSMCFPDRVWPLRAAIASGVVAAHVKPIPWLGIGAVQAAELEKSAQKGMRVLIHGAIDAPVARTRAIDVRGVTHRELNWMNVGDWLSADQIKSLDAIAMDLMEEGTNYSQQLASSIFVLMKWASHMTSVEPEAASLPKSGPL